MEIFPYDDGSLEPSWDECTHGMKHLGGFDLTQWKWDIFWACDQIPRAKIYSNFFNKKPLQSAKESLQRQISLGESHLKTLDEMDLNRIEISNMIRLGKIILELV